MKRTSIFCFAFHLTVGAAAFACGPYPTAARFWYSDRPGGELAHFHAGELGVLEQSFDSFYHFVAWRHLSGAGMDAASLEALASSQPASNALLAHGAPVEPHPVEQWLAARLEVPGTARMKRIRTTRVKKAVTSGGTHFSYYSNCLDDAFRTAAATLRERAVRWGASSKALREWLRGQDLVFSNCHQGESIPEPLDVGWDAGLGADRAYQIAAAHFYSGHFAEAEAHFRRIAADSTSPWATLASYLVGRVQVRDWRFDAAAEQLQKVLADPALVAVHAAAKRMLNHANHRRDPAGRRAELVGELSAEILPSDPRQAWVDFTFLRGEVSPVDDALSVWLNAVRRPASGGDLARQRWRADPSEAWLVALLLGSRGADAGLLEAAGKVAESSPTYLTALVYRARALATAGGLDEVAVRKELAAVLDRQDLSLSDRNRLLSALRGLAVDLDEYLQLAQMEPVEVGYDDGGRGPLRQYWDPGFANYQPGGKLMDDASVALLNRLATAELGALANRESLDLMLRRRVALVAWTRAVALGDFELARSLTPRVVELAPMLSEQMGAFTAASDEERGFVAALLLLRVPGLHPDLHRDVGRATPVLELDPLRANWWCEGGTFVVDPTVFGGRLPSFMDGDPPELERLVALEAGAIHLGKIVLARAESHGDDRRLPEALHLVVRATRFSCWTAEGLGLVSKPAFQILHRRFPNSPWTAKTPHWFD